MTKLKLELDSLNVDSFAVAAGDEKRGTVQGHGLFEITHPTDLTRCFHCPIMPASDICRG